MGGGGAMGASGGGGHVVWGEGGEGGKGWHLYRGSNFTRKCISTTPIRAPIYICVPPLSTRKRQLMKEGNVLFNDALNTFYLWLHGFRHG